jgi:hypothetical protein
MLTLSVHQLVSGRLNPRTEPTTSNDVIITFLSLGLFVMPLQNQGACRPWFCIATCPSSRSEASTQSHLDCSRPRLLDARLFVGQLGRSDLGHPRAQPPIYIGRFSRARAPHPKKGGDKSAVLSLAALWVCRCLLSFGVVVVEKFNLSTPRSQP